ncbi:phosphoglycerate mutase [candidate division KSB3 bacterium]|uniref:phosphoglycerate mutase (2,3-diphosphoglycerate-dependent) n=1 Tax=candidate division KSB3 bacterium TaxID=2044937 RepID=A0A2G6E380_9BACT|nr:MAG: phosphoglycerate mutase [candidate division KSB3 bacterium]PIE29059.1 MAG: phosphoglycerate mutase [candidate division KSB3 bacterium]
MRHVAIAKHTTEIYLVRHGETTLSTGGQYIGSTDVPLSEHGREQARRLAERLRTIHFGACYCSRMERCRETARIAVGPHQLEMSPVADIQEIDYGQWEGLSLQEMEALAPDTFRQWMRDPAVVKAPGGESGQDVLTRIRPVFERLAVTHLGERILIVAHRTVNRLWLCHILGYPLSEYRHAVGQGFTALNIIEYETDRHEPVFSVIRVNDGQHLEQLKGV